jgi:hypothetical protein
VAKSSTIIKGRCTDASGYLILVTYAIATHSALLASYSLVSDILTSFVSAFGYSRVGLSSFNPIFGEP